MKPLPSRPARPHPIAFLCLTLVIGLAAVHTRAGERKFLVILANSPKQYPGPDRDPAGQPTGGLIFRDLIQEQYFDMVPGNDVGSFAEYWEEISYGDVTVTGRVTDWISLPWAIQPPLVDPTRDDPKTGPPIEDDIDDPTIRISPANFYDLNDSGRYRYGTGEPFNNELPMIIVDRDGDPFGVDNGPFFPGHKPGDISQGGLNAGNPVWLPGERFVDVDEDGRWDGLDEANNWMDYDRDGMPDLLGPWIDLNGNGQVGNADDCIYLRDSDNDGNPDCCPDGPGNPGCDPYPAPDACWPTRWPSVGDVEISDCNGNLIPDSCDISCDSVACLETGWAGLCGGSFDRLPYVLVWGTCLPVLGNGVPDECQFEDATNVCRLPDGDCDGPVPPPCCGLSVCVEVDRELRPRCEYIDTNKDDELDIVEPFENFLRRWDPCLFDPDVSTPNLESERAHWIKVYDPHSPSAGTPLECTAPQYSSDYADPAYIINNYPGDAQLVIDQTIALPIYGQHDPLDKLPEPCVCADGTPCETVELPDGSKLEKACVAGYHAEYNPPDNWRNVLSDRGSGQATEYTTKMQAAPGSGGEADFATATPEPGTYAGHADLPWYQQAWEDRYNVGGLVSTPPPWPIGYDPDGEPQPGGPPVGRAVPNTLLMEPYDDVNADTYDPAVDRRFFQANFGGLNGDGTGWVQQSDPQKPGCQSDLAPFILFETGPLGPAGFEQGCNAPILPEEIEMQTDEGDAPIFYDGWVEHDDLPSSKYHMAGDERLGEVTSPFDANIWGHDLGDHDPSTPDAQGDLLIPAAGPYATRIHGDFGRDAGNGLLMELLTWRTDGTSLNNGFVWEHWHGTHHPFAGPGTPMEPNEDLGFRDYNLDGLLDQGEVRPAGSENYLVDSWAGTSNTGTNTVYPFNRQRMLEDCIEVLDDAGIDFDDWIDPVAMERVMCPSGLPIIARLPVQYLTGDPLEDFALGAGVCSGIVLLPDRAHTQGDFPLSPSFYPIHNEDGLGDPEFADANFPRPPATPQINWNIFFHDLVIGLGVESQSGTIPSEDFQVAYAAHEYLHAWEWFPDLYDYDVFGGGLVDCPTGAWDIMARGGLVHPNPVLKERPCTEWIEPVDLATALVPGVEGTLTLPPYELVRDDSAYFLENDDRLGERYYFWSVGEGFDQNMPGAGMLILHHHPAPFYPSVNDYEIVPADGSIQDNCGDDGDPWPGSSGNTTFNCFTTPAATWHQYNQCTGLTITDIVPDGAGSIALTLSWVPTSIPSLRFINPPGGFSVDLPPAVIYQVRAEATDVYGGTWLRFFHTSDGGHPNIDPDGANYIGTVRKSLPGTVLLSIDWNIVDVVDGAYSVFAQLIPGPGADGTESSYTTPRPGRNNVGNGTLSVNGVEVSELVVSGLLGAYVNPHTFVAYTGTGGAVDFEDEGVLVGEQLTTDGFSDRKPVLRTVTAITTIEVDGVVLPALELATDVYPPSGPPTPENPAPVTAWQVVRTAGAARLETWVATCIDPAGAEWLVTSSLTQPFDEDDPDPYPHAFTGLPYASVGGAVTLTIDEGTEQYTRGDTFTFTTTGTTAVSRRVTILDRQISELPSGDWDADGDVDLDDYFVFSLCLDLSGPDSSPLSSDCSALFDFDGDDDIDLRDYRAFELLMTKP